MAEAVRKRRPWRQKGVRLRICESYRRQAPGLQEELGDHAHKDVARVVDERDDKSGEVVFEDALSCPAFLHPRHRQEQVNPDDSHEHGEAGHQEPQDGGRKREARPFDLPKSRHQRLRLVPVKLAVSSQRDASDYTETLPKDSYRLLEQCIRSQYLKDMR